MPTRRSVAVEPCLLYGSKRTREADGVYAVRYRGQRDSKASMTAAQFQAMIVTVAPRPRRMTSQLVAR